MENKHIVIDTKAILTLLGIITLGWIAFQIKTVIIAIFISSVIALGLDPAVRYLTKKKLSRGVSVLIVYVGFLSVLIGIGTLAFTPMVNQTAALINNLPGYIESISQVPELENFSNSFQEEITQSISNIGKGAIQTTVNAFSIAVLSISILVITAYLLLDFENVRENLLSLVPKKNRNETRKVVKEIETKLAYWLRGQITLMLIIGILSYIGLLILDIKFALSLALIAGLLELVPILGPIISVIPALIVSFGDSPIKGLGVLGLYIIIQQLENNLIVPKVMQKAVGFNPLVTMLAILIGGNLMGVMGALLAIPITIIGVIVFKAIYKHLY